MAITLTALDMFRGAAEWSDNTMLNLDKEGGVRQSGTYRFILNALGRGRKAETANNEVRTELVRALVRAFDLNAGARDGTTISDKTLDRLAELIGPVFKREDFTVGPNGAISSGRPLTARRIKAILARVDAAAKAETGRTSIADDGNGEIAVGSPKLPREKAMALVNDAVEFVNAGIGEFLGCAHLLTGILRQKFLLYSLEIALALFVWQSLNLYNRAVLDIYEQRRCCLIALGRA